MKVRLWWLAVLLSSACLPPAEASEASVRRGEMRRWGHSWVEVAECDAPVREGGRLVLRADMGAITVRPGAPERVHCWIRLRAFTSDEAEARRLLESYELGIKVLEGGGVAVTGRLGESRHRHMGMGADYDITVPLRFNLDLETKGGDIRVEKLDGELHAETAGGEILTGDVTGPVRLDTAGGSIRTGNVTRRIEANTAGGNIHVGDAKSDATLETSGGEIVTGLVDGTLHAETAGGDIVLRGARGPVYAETAGGQIQIGEVNGNLRAETAVISSLASLNYALGEG